MLTSSSHGVKATLLRATSKEGGWRVAEPGSGADGYLLHYSYSLLPGTDPTRALSRLHTMLLEGDLRQMWRQAKQRLKSQLQDARSAYQQQQHAKQQPAMARASSAQLEPLYGSNGVFRAAVMYVLAHASRGFMTRLNSTHVEGGQHMEAALARQAGRPLITVCNHVASMDDPLVMSTILPPAAYADSEQLRWTLCASDRCFHRAMLVPFFRAAKVLPVERGAGMAQPGLAAAEARLAAGDWVHIFPEGTRSRDGRMGPVRKGVGRLVASCADARPVILPFVHGGMEEVLPKGSLLPKTNREVRVLVGRPIDVDDLLAAASSQGWSDDALYCAIADRIGTRLAGLKAQLDGAPLDAAAVDAQQAAQRAALEAGWDLYDPRDNAHRAASLWERASFRAAHREWAAGGLVAARARLAAAAEASLAAAAAGLAGAGAAGRPGEALAAAGGGSGDAGDAPASPAAPMLQRWQQWRRRHQAPEQQQAQQQEHEGGAPEGRGPGSQLCEQRQQQQRPLAKVKEWLLATGGSESEYLSRQRSIAMMQLLQARV